MPEAESNKPASLQQDPHIIAHPVAVCATEVKMEEGVSVMMEATRLGARAAKAGFDWPDSSGLLDKVEEECRELRAKLHPPPIMSQEVSTDRIFEELGDLLFAVINLARHLHFDPESALLAANAKF